MAASGTNLTFGALWPHCKFTLMVLSAAIMAAAARLRMRLVLGRRRGPLEIELGRNSGRSKLQNFSL